MQALIVGCLVAGTTMALGANALTLDGKPTDPLDRTNAQAVVLVFVTVDCPISNRYLPELHRLAARHQTNNAQFWLVYPDPGLSAAEIRRHTNEFRCSLPVLRDPEHHFVKLAKARVTPEAAVFKDRMLVYHGRIDNRYVSFGKMRPAATEHDLEQALLAIRSGKQVRSAETRAIGCYIPELRSEKTGDASARPR
ncbi:MAG: redoxin domain-containing protein [Verrucomicrobia subdivision 3 bacterium]|nr:redoxin domain-containing protein [Limisphaerales bacterium]